MGSNNLQREREERANKRRKESEQREIVRVLFILS